MMKSFSALGMIAAATLFSLHWSSAKSLSLSELSLWYFQRLVHRPKFIRLRTMATQNRSLISRHPPTGMRLRQPHRSTRRRRSMQLPFMHPRQST